MKYRRTYLLVTFLLLLISTCRMYAQELSPGFKMLEEGSFEEARSFFSDMFQKYPNNKTIRICYGRAVGLSGDPLTGTQTFEMLLEDYPDDDEVKLNLAESYLWQKKPSNAIPIYKALISRNPGLFAAQLGLANSYSLSQKYDSAYQAILTTLRIAPDNSQAQLSAKYIRLGYANKLASEFHKYDRAIELINENLSLDPKDQESLALLANVYLISKSFERAEATYFQMEDTFQSLKGRTIALHSMKKDKAAMDLMDGYQRRKWKGPLQLDFDLHYVTVLLWNNELSEARSRIDSLGKRHSGEEKVVATQAEVAMYEADFIQAIGHFEKYLQNNPESFSGNLGKANANHALGLDRNAYSIAGYTKRIYPGQAGVEGFIGKLNQKHSPTFYSEYLQGKASDQSNVYGLDNGANLSLTPHTILRTGYEWRTFIPPGGNQTSETSTYYLEIQQQLSKRVGFKGYFGNVGIHSGEQEEAVRGDLDLEARLWINKSLKTAFGYQTEIQNFNAALIEQNLKTQHVFARSIVFWKPISIGWYSEAYRSFFSDGNTRSLLFTSLYRNETIKNGSLKYGLNVLLMGFEESKPLDYYSPSSFFKPELFTGVQFTDEGTQIAIQSELAGSYQFVDGQAQPNYRFQTTVSKAVGAFTFLASATYTTIAVTQTSDFSYLEVKGKLSWRIGNRPLFRRYADTNQ